MITHHIENQKVSRGKSELLVAANLHAKRCTCKKRIHRKTKRDIIVNHFYNNYMYCRSTESN